ncbi:hypothetical protein MHYP_G00286940 [Metynnis hypsauchen]
MEEVLKGNAALSLKNVQPHHRGEYTCDVNNEIGKTEKKIQLIVAAPYEDPQMAVHYTCSNVVVTLSSSRGFPEPAVSWKHPVGRNVTTTELHTEGFYRVQSNLTLSFNTTQTVVVEMRLEILSQCFIKEITLHPLQGCCISNAAHVRNRFLLILTLTAFIVVQPNPGLRGWRAQLSNKMSTAIPSSTN